MKKRYLPIVLSGALMIGCAADKPISSDITGQTDVLVTSVTSSLTAVTTTSAATVTEIPETTAEPKSKTPSEYSDVTDRIVTLGIPLSDTYPSGSIGRVVYDIAAYDGLVFVGGGDDYENLGPVPSYAYNEEKREWQKYGELPEEKIRRFYTVNGKLATSGTDPKDEGGDEWNSGNWYTFDDGEWTQYRNIPYGAHNYDIVGYDGGIFIGIGSAQLDNNSHYPVVMSDDGGKSFSDVEFRKDGAAYYISDFSLTRVYNLVEFKGTLYCYAWFKETGINEYSLYRYDKSANAFEFIGAQSDLLSRIKYNPRDFTAFFEYKNRAFAVNENGMFVTDDLTEYDEIIPDGADYISDACLYDGTR